MESKTMKIQTLISLIVTPIAAFAAVKFIQQWRMKRLSDGRLSESERAMREDPMWYLAVLS